ncbi:MAG: class B sortase [Ruminococcaceae bacterium]|nr:class B sortase [Oscillospiraceae bacterium]
MEVNVNEEAVQKPKGKRALGAVRIVLLCLFSVIFIVSAVKFVLDISERKRGNDLYGELKGMFPDDDFIIIVNGDTRAVSKLDRDFGYASELSITARLEGQTPEAEPTPPDISHETSTALMKVRASIDSLREINKDIYGWISISGTSIDYPIAQASNNDYYLNHAYNGSYSPLGSIFADYRCSDKLTDNMNTVFYGHNLMTGGEDMFHDIEMFLNQNFFNSTQIIVYTYHGIYVYQPFAVFETRYDYNYYKTHFKSTKEFLEFTNAMKNNSRCYSDAIFTEEDRVLTLSTCTNREYFTRYALQAKLISAIED